MQATLDTEFIAQTLALYTTEEASNVQSQIYVELDRRTTNEARTKLQAELGDMRIVLKKLRDRTKGEFACFKKPRGAGGSSSKSSTSGLP
jgi:exocyst complex component 2